MSNDRRKNSRRPSVPLSAEARAGRVPEPMPLDPMEQRNARRIGLESIGRELIIELGSVNHELNKRQYSETSHDMLQSRKHELKDQCVTVLAQLCKL